MIPNDPALEIEIIIDPTKFRKAGRREKQAKPQALDQPRIPRLSRLMALAIKFQDMVDRGEIRDYADIARLGYVSRARITQIMNLLNLAPDIQEQILLSNSPKAIPCERYLRRIVSLLDWPEQRRRLG
jgi:hypothetical protein